MQEFTVYAPGKLNLYLDVLEKMPDGYHNLRTVFEKIDLKDEITIKKKARGVKLKVYPSGICPSGKDNIVYRAASAIIRECGGSLGIDITIKKKIPVSSGLGGGSSDAASVLRAINEKFGLGVSPRRLFSIAEGIGKDIPFFMLDAAFAIGMGTGNDLRPLDISASFSHIIIKPSISVSTAEMYKRVDSHKTKTEKPDINGIVLALQSRDLALLNNSYYNIFESVLKKYRPYVASAKDLLLKAGASRAFLSGSGPSVFCTVNDRKDVVALSKKIIERQGMDIFLSTTYKGGIYGNN